MKAARVATILVTLTAGSLANPAGATEGASTTRLAGTTRITTATQVSANRFAADQAHAVVLARSDNYPDALAGGPLAVATDGPLLLTPPASLDATTRSELDRVLPAGGTVYLLGGTAALSTTVENQVRAAGYSPVRYGGTTRFETAVIVNRDGLGSPSTFFLADGRTFADALIAAAAAPSVDAGVLLTDSTTMPPETSAYLTDNSGSQRFAIGATAATASPTATKVGGTDKYVTAQAVADRFFDAPNTVAVASGTNFPDALAGGAHIGAFGGPLLLVEVNAAPRATTDFLEQNKGTIGGAYVYGGTGVVSAAVEQTIRNVIDTSVTFGDGTHRIGTDIPAGTYRTRAASGGCYWERLSGFSGERGDIVANEFTDDHTIVTIASSDAGFSTDGCGTWTSDLSALTASPTAPFGSGTWIVGTDIAAGTWRASGGSSCYWERLSGFSGEGDDIIANDFGSTNPVVTMAASDEGFASNDCGNWTRQ